jgi:hypothetical protein
MLRRSLDRLRQLEIGWDDNQSGLSSTMRLQELVTVRVTVAQLEGVLSARAVEVQQRLQQLELQAKIPALPASEDVKQKHRQIRENFESCWLSSYRVSRWQLDLLAEVSPADVEGRTLFPCVPVVHPDQSTPNLEEYESISMAPEEWYCRWLVQKERSQPAPNLIDQERRHIIGFFEKLRAECINTPAFVRFCRNMRSPAANRLAEVLSQLECLEKANFLLARKHNLSTGVRDRGRDPTAVALWHRPRENWYNEQTSLCRWTRRFLAALDRSAPQAEIDGLVAAATQD